MTGSDVSSIQTFRHGAGMRAVLNEPRALNALSPALIEELWEKLNLWQDDASLGWLTIEGAGGKAFSAGADVRAMWRHAVAGEYEAIKTYFAREYDVDLLLSEYRKPVIALVDGICFGGGMGLAMHSRYCVATDAASFSMPETLIGFFPDAGATWFLPKLPGKLGLYFGMTGARIAGPDAARFGLASHYLPREHFETIATEIAERGPDRLKELDFATPPSLLAEIRPQIDDCFCAGSVHGIFERLERNGSDWAKETLATLRARSPASLEWTFESLGNAGKSLAACLRKELELVAISTGHPDFQEGIRAALIDKDKMPRWRR